MPFEHQVQNFIVEEQKRFYKEIGLFYFKLSIVNHDFPYLKPDKMLQAIFLNLKSKPPANKVKLIGTFIIFLLKNTEMPSLKLVPITDLGSDLVVQYLRSGSFG